MPTTRTSVLQGREHVRPETEKAISVESAKIRPGREVPFSSGDDGVRFLEAEVAELRACLDRQDVTGMERQATRIAAAAVRLFEECCPYLMDGGFDATEFV